MAFVPLESLLSVVSCSGSVPTFWCLAKADYFYAQVLSPVNLITLTDLEKIFLVATVVQMQMGLVQSVEYIARSAFAHIILQERQSIKR